MKARWDPCDAGRLGLLAEDRLPPGELTRLEQHLERCPRCRDTLDRIVGTDRCAEEARRYLDEEGGDEDLLGPSDHPDGPLDFLAPSDWPDSIGRLGTYEVKGVLGRGGMSVVLKALDPALGRVVAIKVMTASLASCGAARRRFFREAKAAAAVVHEHVVGIFAVDEAAGLPFLVMEYVPGRSLQDRLDALGPLPVTEVLRIGMQTASGLAAAHAQGLVHRDVKPANILLEDGVERARLTDFGLARAAADAAMTRSGVVAGTPHYMAPEQARGETADPRADLYGLGSTLYATLAGFPPFRAESPLAVLRRVCDDEPRPLRGINAEVPDWLEAIIAKLMAKDPGRRHQSAAEVADLLAACLAHVQQPLASPLPDALRRRPDRRRRWAVAATLALALTAATASASLAAWKAWGPSPAVEDVGARQTFSAPSPRPSAPADGGPDDILRQLEQARAHAASIEAELRRPARPDEDGVSGLAGDLATRAEALERELLPARASPSTDGSRVPPTFPSPTKESRR
ncbi:Serine/threonine-protein kinase PknB [Aquisphaera giovannonii]|uniref:non-specific serine/threonine protein kinase n=1 Tax=Aquisphaera giovannonii TaxID=406548 RepID=A0A5B9VU64_9BACT|nr:protein kinase [Aquisphaera giovannonii]QEH31778.1 Serine/threonine-protein kinase PknB [Aquisphaera giovannonii]